MAQDTRGENDNVVVVRNHQPGAFRWRARSAIAHDPGPSATNQNVAYAYASCTDCRTVAVAVQVVVLEGPVTDFRPANAAVAVNDSCLRCQTYAYGHQVVLSAGRMVELSADAEQRVDQLDHQMDQVAASSEGFDQMTSDLDQLTAQLVSAVQDGIRGAGNGAEAADASEGRQVQQEA